MRLMRLTTILAVFAVHVYISAVLSFSSRVTYGNEITGLHEYVCEFIFVYVCMYCMYARTCVRTCVCCACACMYVFVNYIGV